MSRIYIVLSAVVASLIISDTTMAQANVVKTKTVAIEPEIETLSQYFEDYLLVQHMHQKSSNKNLQEIELQLTATEKVSVILYPSELLADNHIISGIDRNINRDELAIPYEGYIKGASGSEVRLTIDEHTLYGTLSYKKLQYFIEPANTFDKTLSPELHIVYSDQQVRKNQDVSCASTELHRKSTQTSHDLKSAGDCELYELAIAVDYNYSQTHGGPTGAINQTIAVMNMVAGVYDTQFSDEVRFSIVEHYVPSCSSCNPWTSSTDANALLNSFTTWGPGGFTATHDIGQLWTDRNICGTTDCSVAGLAWIDAVCGTWRYHILEDFTTTSWQLRVLVSHEMGHNFGSHHDGGNGHIMAPSVSVNTTTWSSQSISAVNSARTGYTCYEDCLIGSCSEIVSAVPSNCTPGISSTYDLTLEIRHGGGGSSSSFDVNVNGQNYNYAWGISPQTIVITGLLADGTLSNAVSIAANDGSDTGCAGSANYDEPTGSCSVTYTEDFNSCALPAGWSETSTNIYTWNSGDPLVQYEWKFDDGTRQFANYNVGENAATSKTIDGSCMALMDDDIINHDLYTGEVVLNTPIYNMNDFDTVMLKFDYNFHPFEDGGKGANNSFFEVEVYNGATWISVLYDDDSASNWYNVWDAQCITSMELDLTQYSNSEFRVRFIYNDGNDGKWTGMIALDNVEVKGTTIDNSGPCENMLELDNQILSGPYVARDMIVTMADALISTSASFAADTVSVEAGLEVSLGAEFSIMADGCGN